MRWLARKLACTWVHLTLLTAIASPGCLDTQLVALSRLEIPVPQLTGKEWKPQVEEALEFYRSAPVLASPDERFGPIVGGITTLTYFAPDFGQKLADQRLGAEPADGVSMASACGRPLTEQTPGTRAPIKYEGVWLPLAIVSGATASNAECNKRGASTRADSFCMFGRLALHSDSRAGRPLILVVHGMFDSSSQLYVEHVGNVLFALDFDVLLLDMRDHGNTLRAMPTLPSSLGALEGPDLRDIARQAKAACPERIAGVGAVGVSAGGLNVISAYAGDETTSQAPPALDRGVIALSPLLDIEHTMAGMANPPSCSVVQAVELTWAEHAVLGSVGGASFFAGSAVSKALADDALNGTDALAAVIGVAAGIGTSLLVDMLLDGHSLAEDGCVARGSVSTLFRDLLQARWRSLTGIGAASGLSQSTLSISDQHITLDEYLRLRSWPYYEARGVTLTRPTAAQLATRLHSRRVPANPERTKLLILSAADDPVTPIVAHDQLHADVGDRADILIAAVEQGGHGAMWSVQELAMRLLVERFFRDLRDLERVTDPRIQ